MEKVSEKPSIPEGYRLATEEEANIAASNYVKPCQACCQATDTEGNIDRSSENYIKGLCHPICETYIGLSSGNFFVKIDNTNAK